VLKTLKTRKEASVTESLKRKPVTDLVRAAQVNVLKLVEPLTSCTEMVKTGLKSRRKRKKIEEPSVNI
jgi:hypothetical protein